MRAENFPKPLRLLNDYDFGGFEILRTPDYPVFIDGREDVYLGPIMNGYARLSLTMRANQYRTPIDAQFLDSYDFDCVLTGHPIIASYFVNKPDWAVVYADRPGDLFDKRINH